jgi:hypothetical protein
LEEILEAKNESLSKENLRMKAALRNILELSQDELSLSQARYGLGINRNKQ